MKEYYKQLQDFAKSEILAPKEKLSYGEALEDLMYLSKDIHQTKTRTEQLQDNSHTSVPSSWSCIVDLLICMKLIYYIDCWNIKE